MNWPSVWKLVSLRGKVAYWRGVGCVSGAVSPDAALLELGNAPRDTTIRLTRSPDLRIRSTTCSWLAALTSSPLIYQKHCFQTTVKIVLNKIVFHKTVFVVFCFILCYTWNNLFPPDSKLKQIIFFLTFLDSRVSNLSFMKVKFGNNNNT